MGRSMSTVSRVVKNQKALGSKSSVVHKKRARFARCVVTQSIAQERVCLPISEAKKDVAEGGRSFRFVFLCVQEKF